MWCSKIYIQEMGKWCSVTAKEGFKTSMGNVKKFLKREKTKRVITDKDKEMLRDKIQRITKLSRKLDIPSTK